MLKINFYPDSDREDRLIGVKKGMKEYKDIWEKDGEKIVETIESVSNLSFVESEINAIVYISSLNPRSIPLSLRANALIVRKKGTLVHELCHRLISGNGFRIKVKDRKEFSLEVHKLLNLILYDIWIDVYGEQLAKSNLDYESGIPSYKEAWEWALSFSKKERAEKFKEASKINHSFTTSYNIYNNRVSSHQVFPPST